MAISATTSASKEPSQSAQGAIITFFQAYAKLRQLAFWRRFEREDEYSPVFLEAIVQEKMAGGTGRKPSDGTALGGERQRHLLQEQLHPVLTPFPMLPRHLERRQRTF